jgi:NADPH-dependent glutamate synthase beta subunit-like oxidoreductase
VVCPTGAIVDKDGEWLGREVGLPPCTNACPAEIDIPSYVRLVAQRRFAEAAAVIREKVPFPGVLGRVCFHPCENKCRRLELNEAISIAAIKRAAAERDVYIWHAKLTAVQPTGKRVVVVGSGPSGLTAGFYLARKGHSVTVFEALPEAGGMMRVGIPEYRLPREVLDAEIDEIKRLGVELKTNTRVKSINSLLKTGYDAVLLAVGTHKPLKLGVPGENSPGMMEGIPFLRDINMGKKIKLEGNVAVIGGGNVAIDAARTALRLGAKAVRLICLETPKEMPAHVQEIEEAMGEGITLCPSWGIKQIIGDSKTVKGLDCIRCTSVFDKDGKFSPSFDESVTTFFNADAIIVAIGQVPDLSFFEKKSNLQSTGGKAIRVDDNLKTKVERVFATGDAVSGPTSVIEAVASGRKAAMVIDKYLGGSGVIDEKLVEIEAPASCLGPGDGFADLSRVEMPCLPIALRLAPVEAGHFTEVETGLTEEMAVEEAKRCLQCQLRFQLQPIPLPPEKESG